MPALPMIEHLQKFEHRCSGLIVGPKTVLGQQFALQGGEKTFHHGVVKTVAHRSHRTLDPRCRPPLTEEQRGVTSIRDPSDESAPHRDAGSRPPSPTPPGPVRCAGGPPWTNRP